MSDTAKPIRIQRQRTKGWKMPPNTIYVGRPTKWGNPYYIYHDGVTSFEQAVALYSMRLKSKAILDGAKFELDLRELRGKNLCCWCPLDRECHASVLLELANR